MNCGPGSSDEPKDIQKNLKIVSKKIKAKSKKIFLLNQVHSNKLHYLDKYSDINNKFLGDALVTNKKNIPIAVLTADCVPILIYDNNLKIISVIHAGWKGAFTGILENTISKMCELGATKENITAAIGPCISQASYEVGPEFFEKIQDDKYFLKSTNEGNFQFNLESYVYDKLLSTGLNNIDALNTDTYPINNGFFSYRRKTHLNEEDYGRQISIILQN